MRVFAVASYPVEAAATRFRVVQFIPHLRERGVEVFFSPFVGSSTFKHLYDRRRKVRTAIALAVSFVKRIVELVTLKRADVILVQREAMLFGPPLFERLAAARVPLVLDLDDSTYLGTINSVYGKLVAVIRWPQKVPELIRLATVVLCGNEQIARHVAETYGAEARVVPTVVDLDTFKPIAKGQRTKPLVGWIGTQATYGYLEELFPILERLREKHDFVLKIVGSDRPAPKFRTLDVDWADWSLEREVEDFASLDVGLYPLRDEPYAHGKSGLKAIQYMAVGIPFVTSPVGVCATIGERGRTHLLASSHEDWYQEVDRLLSDATLRRDMGQRGRQHALTNFTVEKQAESIVRALRESIDVRNRRNRRAA